MSFSRTPLGCDETVRDSLDVPHHIPPITSPPRQPWRLAQGSLHVLEFCRRSRSTCTPYAAAQRPLPLSSWPVHWPPKPCEEAGGHTQAQRMGGHRPTQHPCHMVQDGHQGRGPVLHRATKGEASR